MSTPGSKLEKILSPNYDNPEIVPSKPKVPIIPPNFELPEALSPSSDSNISETTPPESVINDSPPPESLINDSPPPESLINDSPPPPPYSELPNLVLAIASSNKIPPPYYPTPSNMDEEMVPTYLKCSIYLINFIYWFLGVFCVIVGLFVQVDQLEPINDFVDIVINPAFIMMVLGCMMFVTSTFGCVGVLRENLSILRWFLVALLILLVVHVTLGASSFIAFFSSTSLKDNTEMNLQKALNSFQESRQSSDYMNYVQNKFQCCGVGTSGYRDWENNPYFACTGINRSQEKCSVPFSCCKVRENEHIDTMCGYGVTYKNKTMREVAQKVNIKGCIGRFDEIMKNAAAVLGIVSFGAAVPLLCGALLCSRMITTLEEAIKRYWRNERMRNNTRFNVVYYNDNTFSGGNIGNVKPIV